MPERYFTIEEANATLPQLRSLIEQVWQARAVILDARPDLVPVLQKATNNGGSRRASEMIAEFEQVQLAVHAIQETGCLLKDAERGLVDFPSRRQGREIYLCWLYGEEHVGFWHEMDSGFAGRQAL